MPTDTRVRGRIMAYRTGTIHDIDRHLTQLTTSWQEVRGMTPPPTANMRADYQADVDMLLEARAKLMVL